MTSVNEVRVRQRVSAIYDAAHGSQGTAKSIAEYVKTLTKGVGIHTETMKSAADFNSEIGSI